MFKKGVSANPAGRPKINTAYKQLREQITDELPAIVDVLIGQALSGDTAAATALLNRVLPALKPQAQSFTVPIGSSLAEQGNLNLGASLTGQIPSDTDAQLMSSLAAQAKVIETTDLITRIELIEAKS